MADHRSIRSGNACALLSAMLKRREAEVGEVRGLRVTEDPEHAAFFPELVHCWLQFERWALRLISVRFHAIALAGSKYRSIAVFHVRSTSASDSSMTLRPSIVTWMRVPQTTPILLVGTLCWAARSSNCTSAAGATDTTTRDADSENNVEMSENVFGPTEVTVGTSTCAPKPVPMQPSPEVLANPPSAQSCADTITPA